MSRSDGPSLLSIILIPLAIIVVVAAMSIGWWVLRVENADRIGSGNAEIQLEGENSRIPRYEHFYDLCVSVQNAEEGLNAEYDRLDRTTDPTQRAVIETNISALRVTRAAGINQYNADSAKYYTDARFKGYNLPESLPVEAYVKGGPITQCAP